MSVAAPFPPEHPRANLSAYVEVKPSKEAREKAIYAAMVRYFAETKFEDVTGGELAEFIKLSVLAIRPRLHDLAERHVLSVTASMRLSRAIGERRCHAYYLPLKGREE